MLRKIIFVIAGVILLLVMLFFLYNEPTPEGEEGPAAELLAHKMLNAINFEAWDSTVAVSWSFYRGHHFIWDKKRNFVQVKWDDMRVLLNTTDLTGRAFKDELELKPEETKKALQTAWEYFANDSFWLAAPFKIMDPGTKRSLVKTGEGDALLVRYTSGGVTPGDAYLWLLGEEGTPTAWKLWVKVIPIGGMRFTWDHWKTYSTGARIATFHDGIINVTVSDVQLSMNAADLNGGDDPFAKLHTD